MKNRDFLMKFQINENTRIAVIPAQGLGDGLIQMTLAYHFAKMKHRVDFFHHFLAEIQDWFPTVNVFRTNDDVGALRQYDHVIFLDHHKACMVADTLSNSFVLPKEMINQNISMLDNIIQISQHCFGLIEMTKNNGIKIPGGLVHRKFKNRIIIHPTSTDIAKNWPAGKFIKLARTLKANGLNPIFIVSPNEREMWSKISNNKFELPNFATIDMLARFIYESYAMIGNDSGIGHLASNLGLPTLSIFSSKKRAKLWRPDFNENIYVVPKFKIPGRWFKNSWKYFISVDRVYQTAVKYFY